MSACEPNRDPNVDGVGGDSALECDRHPYVDSLGIENDREKIGAAKAGPSGASASSGVEGQHLPTPRGWLAFICRWVRVLIYLNTYLPNLVLFVAGGRNDLTRGCGELWRGSTKRPGSCFSRTTA